MDELVEFCARMLGDLEAGEQTAQVAREAAGPERIARLMYAVRSCRVRAVSVDAAPVEVPAAAGPERSTGDLDLAAAVAGEVAAASAQLPPRQREALALRELLGLQYGEIGKVIGLERAAVAPLLARSRLRLRAELRGVPVETSDCPERERTLRTVTLRQDREPVPAADDDWLVDHLGHCPSCARAHAGMLEGSVCYRGWRAPAAPADAAADPEPSDPEPSDPEPSDPEPSHLEPSDPEPSDPEPTP